ncbi:glycerophosphodiester phosphodiesterase [Arthrobacter sp. E918]|uniref:Glycerophosphodiester phosphodiesterase n=1 Tax=Arthrobacter mobilis TaxID=2724944 RepID=A0A7X6HDJ0_9MICC|nr:glycerophosphodiester phosphodiesterase family protein [Arthrobacter mobilis]NKX55138.1 glycerophosphodiester phosphodiesterase [Arthrobacter mobilis]
MPIPYLENVLPGPGRAPVAFAHRGFSPAGHENSMAAFRAAVDLGYGYLETDVRTSADGVLMVFHDATLDRVTDGTGPFSARTAAQLRQVRIGGVEPIPTMEELLAEWPDVKINVDVKDRPGSALLAGLIERYGAHDRILVTSFSDRRRLGVFRTLSRPAASSGGVLSVAALTSLGRVGLARTLGRAARMQAVQVPVRYGRYRLVTPAFVSRCHRAGLAVHVWTVNEREEMERLLEMGVDGLMTDRADVLAGLMQERGFWPQRVQP